MKISELQEYFQTFTQTLNNKIMNVAEILKYCPKGTKLYSTVFGEVKFSEVYPNNMIVVSIKDGCKRVFYKDGSYSEYGECVLFPSKDQRDWSKFRLPLKRGDIMMDANGECPFIATGEFKTDISPKYICGINSLGNFQLDYAEAGWTSIFYILASEEAKKKLFNKMAEAGYKWNVDTLELEKIEPKFKEGDIVVDRNGDIILVSKANNFRIISNAVLYTKGDFIIYSDARTYFVSDINFASIEDKNKLFSALVREGYRYDEKQHRLIKQEFKPFDKVLMRNEDNQTWRACLFSHYREDLSCPYVCVGCSAYKQCIPYEGNEYLVGTTKNP